MTNVLVTGGAGFVGSHLVDHLVAEGYSVTVVDSLHDQVHDADPEYRNEHAEYVWEDIRNRSVIADLLREADVVSHQASAVGVGQSMYEIERYVDANSRGTALLLDVIVEQDIDLEKFVLGSSMTVYGEGRYQCPECGESRYPSRRDATQLAEGRWEHRCEDCGTVIRPRPTPEDTPHDPSSVYAVTKQSQEQLCRVVGRSYDIPTVCLRYFPVYGSRQALDNPYAGVCAIFSSRIKNDNPPLLFEDGEQTRDFVHVSDVARANHAAIEADVADEIINVGTGTPTSVRTVAETLIELFGRRDQLDAEVANDYRAGDIRHCYADMTRAEELLDFVPQVSFEEGMRELVEWGRTRDAEDNFEQAYEELASNNLIDE